MFDLKEIALFSKLEEKQLVELQSRLHIHNYTKDSIVFYEGDESKYLHLLLDGAVRLYKTSPKGTQIHMHNFTAPDSIALFATFQRIPFPATCEFLTEGTIGLLPLDKIHSCLENTEFALALITALSCRMKLLSDVLHKETIYSAEAKIADLIYNNPAVFERLKNNEIASILNITPETLSRTLSKFKKEAIITINERVVRILDKKRLQDIIETNYLES